jgi:hypothetical protein
MLGASERAAVLPRIPLAQQEARPMANRKLFLVQIATFALALAGCGGGGSDAAPAPAPSPPPAPPPPPAAPCSAFSFSLNHGHTLSIPRADLDSTVAKTYSIAGSAGHDHQVTLSPAQLQQLKSGGTVSVGSFSSTGHEHQMSGGCA